MNYYYWISLNAITIITKFINLFKFNEIISSTRLLTVEKFILSYHRWELKRFIMNIWKYLSQFDNFNLFFFFKFLDVRDMCLVLINKIDWVFASSNLTMFLKSTMKIKIIETLFWNFDSNGHFLYIEIDTTESLNCMYALCCFL